MRPTIVILLLVAATGGAYLATTLQRTGDALVASQLDVEEKLARMTRAAADIGAAQEAYVAPGQPDDPWLQRVSELIQQLVDWSAAIRPRLRSTEAAERLQALAANLDTLLTIDGRIRVNLRNGQDLSASDLIFTDGRDTVTAIVDTLVALAANERAAFDAERAGLGQQGWALLLIVAAIWIAGAAALVWVPALQRAPLESERATAGWSPADTTYSPEPTATVTQTVAGAAPAPTIDLAAAAEVCTSISRVTSTSALPDLLARLAVVLDASGVILWMGAGEELFAVTAHGYDPKIVSRLGPIGRHANNATAAAWRTGELGTVASDVMSNGAIVAPMFGVDSCIGVLAAELRHGREGDQATRAVTAMFAAQLATIVAAWPAPSEASPTQTEPADPIAASL